MSKKDNKKNSNIIERPPIIVVMGHIDHGKSTLLDYIRTSNVVEKEAGGITQHMYSYEISHKNTAGEDKKITFLDTPGHEAFKLMRERGANVADIAILVVAADDGVKKQTLEAIKIIKESKIPYIVAINKIDLPNANVIKVKQDLAENEVFLEGYGGDISSVEISAKSGTGINEILDLMLLVAQLEEFKGDTNKEAEGIIIEAHHDTKKGISAILLIQDGTLQKGSYVAVEDSLSPVRRIDNFLGESVDSATFSSPVRITGFNKTPKVGSQFLIFSSKKEAEKYASSFVREKAKDIKIDTKEDSEDGEDEKEKLHLDVPIIIKSDTEGTLEAVLYELLKIKVDNVSLNILDSGVGNIKESDIKRASGAKKPIIVGFNVTLEKSSSQLAEQLGVDIKTFTIIYKLTEWLEEELIKRKPMIEVEESTGKAKIIRVFSRTKDKQVVGGKVKEGKIVVNEHVKILRRDFQIGSGKIIELQQKKIKVSEALEGTEYGALIEAKHEIAEGDYIEGFVVVSK